MRDLKQIQIFGAEKRCERRDAGNISFIAARDKENLQ